MQCPIEIVRLLADFLTLCGPGVGGAAQDARADELMAVAQLCRSDRRMALQSAAWRSRAHGRRASWRMVARDRDAHVRDLNTVLRSTDNGPIYGPLRVRHLIRVLNAQLGMADSLMFAMPRLQPIYEMLQARAIEEAQAMEDRDGEANVEEQ